MPYDPQDHACSWRDPLAGLALFAGLLMGLAALPARIPVEVPAPARPALAAR
ncbi:hypothetical protein M446_4789 [Methylobacterium sp. 4-46]|uniref:hypothetical protein n=1 Tax=unclassified Methylobacterium TaxID=2615210 RepID=UPI000165CD15|nr:MULTISPECIES: hypothetical protein [Methylobacterium]ACA19119.1 hypothetical protein M446_4789 [Methylobacterium sp. 4-46]WFT78330.1 hypothetical protein QA634_24070 [Methylobacterium nodulans]